MKKNIVNISAYKFVALTNLTTIKELLLAKCISLDIKGTIILAEEGINLNLAGSQASIDAICAYFNADERFEHLPFKFSYSNDTPFEKMVIKIKPEIVTMGVRDIDFVKHHGKDIAPETFKQWLDENRDIVVLDTRNAFEVEYGTFEKAIDFNLDHFRQFPDAVDTLDPSLKEKPVVMFCTGGIRCEKASVLMEEKGFKEVYQLSGGILKYFETCHGAHWKGDCFVFDERVTVDAQLNERQ